MPPRNDAKAAKESVPAADPSGVPVSDYRDIYAGMYRIRQCEEQLNGVFARNLFPGYIHSYLGQEACAVGICFGLRKDDCIVTTHRGRGHYLAKGMALKPMMAEMFGKATGIGGGRGGEMHAADPAVGILGGNGIVGGGIPYAAGAAYSALLDGSDRVSVAFFGDGASNQGSFHETMNIAAAWSLPLIMVCENNMYAEMTPFRETVKEVDIAKRAVGYDIPGLVVDGNDVLAVLAAARTAVARARAGEGPTLLELKTYRHGGHFQGDPCKYRTRDEEEAWRSRDPVHLFRAKLLEAGVCSDQDLQALEAALTAEITESIDYALASPDPVPADALNLVYAP